MSRSIQKKKKKLLKQNNIFLALGGLYQLEQTQIIVQGDVGNVKKNHHPKTKKEYTDTAGIRPNVNFLLAAAVHRLCLADDLTLHVTCGDITHSCERKSEYGLRARCLPSKSHRTEADTRSHRFTNNILRPFQNLLSIYFTIITHWSAPILHHCCKNSNGPQQILSAIPL